MKKVDADVKEKTIQTEPLESPVFIGRRIFNGNMINVTGAMDFDEAYSWAMAHDRFSDFGKNTSWGLYTEHEVDAYHMAMALGGYAEPVFDMATPGSGIYNHFHVNGRNFQDHFKHFHIWYGRIV